MSIVYFGNEFHVDGTPKEDIAFDTDRTSILFDHDEFTIELRVSDTSSVNYQKVIGALKDICKGKCPFDKMTSFKMKNSVHHNTRSLYKIKAFTDSDVELRFVGTGVVIRIATTIMLTNDEEINLVDMFYVSVNQMEAFKELTLNLLMK
jgi:hypothetical protein